MKTLAIDIGGTKFSIALFDGSKMVERVSESQRPYVYSSQPVSAPAASLRLSWGVCLSVGRRALDGIDDDGTNGTAGGFGTQAKLFSDRGGERRDVSSRRRHIRRALARELQLDVESFRNAGLVDHRTPDELLQIGREPPHRSADA